MPVYPENTLVSPIQLKYRKTTLLLPEEGEFSIANIREVL